MARVWFGWRRETTSLERSIVMARIFLWSIIPFFLGSFFLSRLWWVSFLLLCILCTFQYYIDVWWLGESDELG